MNETLQLSLLRSTEPNVPFNHKPNHPLNAKAEPMEDALLSSSRVFKTQSSNQMVAVV